MQVGTFGGGGSSATTANTLGAVGSLFGPAAGAVGSLIGSVAGLFDNSPTPNGTTEFDGLHSPTLPKIEASSLKMGEVRILAGYAQGLRISVEEVMELIKTDAATTGHSIEYVLDAWRNNYSPMLDNARIYLARYNARNPSAPIREGVLGPLPLSAGGSIATPFVSSPLPAPASVAAAPQYQPSFLPLSTSQAYGSGFGFTGGGSGTLNYTSGIGGKLGPYIDAAITGAQDGITKVGMNTEAGKAAIDQGAVEFLKNRWYIPLAIVMTITGLVVALFTRK